MLAGVPDRARLLIPTHKLSLDFVTSGRPAMRHTSAATIKGRAGAPRRLSANPIPEVPARKTERDQQRKEKGDRVKQAGEMFLMAE